MHLMLESTAHILCYPLSVCRRIEAHGRVCYQSRSGADTADDFVRMLIKRGHESVLEHEKVTVLFLCDRGISHELVRHRIASFSQESTRYCNYSDKGLTFLVPPNLSFDAHQVWMNHMMAVEDSYNRLIELGVKPELARSVLPHALKVEMVMTANLREWRLIFKQRCAKEAHPQMRSLMKGLLKEMKEKLPVVFEDITGE